MITEIASSVVMGTGNRLQHNVSRNLSDLSDTAITDVTPTGVSAADISVDRAGARRLGDHLRTTITAIALGAG